jgi:hypothetical protein
MPEPSEIRRIFADPGRVIHMYARRASLGVSLMSLFWLAYLVVGVVVASDHKYFDHVGSVKLVIDAVLAVLVWPLILLGVHIHI